MDGANCFLDYTALYIPEREKRREHLAELHSREGDTAQEKPEFLAASIRKKLQGV